MKLSSSPNFGSTINDEQSLMFHELKRILNCMESNKDKDAFNNDIIQFY